MGFKDNFQQALRELTGTEKEESKRSSNKVDGMKNAVAAVDDTGEFDAVRPGSEGSSYEEIQRRAAAAADEYSKQQSTYSAGSYQSDGSDVRPQDMSFGDDILESGLVADGQPLTLGSESTARPEPAQNTSSRQESASSDIESGTVNFQKPGTRDRYEQTSQRVNMGGNTSGYSRYDSGFQDRGYQQPTGGYRQSMGGAPDPASEQQMIFSASRYGRNVNDEDEITVISRNTVIDGNVRSFANMSVDGNVKGNIETTKDIDLNGKVVGNIACNNAQMRTSQIQGNIQMKGNAYMERDTLLIGDLTSTYANVNGKIKGNLDITGKAELKSDAVVFGDISASTITVNDGAIIQGYVSTNFLNKEESRNIFPDTITIGE